MAGEGTFRRVRYSHPEHRPVTELQNSPCNELVACYRILESLFVEYFTCEVEGGNGFEKRLSECFQLTNRALQP